MKDRKLLNVELGRLTADEYRQGRAESGLVLVLDNVRSAHNAGSAFRTADAFGVDKLYLGGICPVPPSPELRKVALGAEEVVPFEHVEDVVALVGRLKADGYTVAAVEQTVHSVKLDRFRREPGKKYALVFGNEVAGVEQSVVDESDFSLEIPEGWQVTKQSDSSCTVEAVEKPEEGSNFGWSMDVSVWSSSVFKAEDTIKDEQDVFEDSKSQPDQKFGGYTFLYTYMAYEFGDHSVLAAPLREDGGCIQVKIGGYKLENTPALQEILKSLKVKKTE